MLEDNVYMGAAITWAIKEVFEDKGNQKLFGTLVRAEAFAKYIAPNKLFAEHEGRMLIKPAQTLVDELEKEISRLKGSGEAGRDDALANAREYKRAISGFIIHANKEGV